MKLYLKNKSLFEKSAILTSFLQEKIKDLKTEEITVSLSHIAKHHYGYRKEPLTEKEMLVYDLLLKEDINPETAYEWMLATKGEEDIKQKLENKEISQKEAIRLIRNNEERVRVNKSLSVLKECRKLIAEVF